MDANKDEGRTSRTDTIKDSVKRNYNKIFSKRNLFKEYCEHTAIHGIRYIGENKRKRFERILWTILILAAFGACLHMIVKVWYKRQLTPVVVSFADKSTPVWQIPFPSVLLCPDGNIKSEVFSLTEFVKKFENSDNFTYEEWLYYDIAAQMCPEFLTEVGIPLNITNYNFTDEEILKHLIEMSPKARDTLDECKWKKQNQDCEKIFDTVLTETGVCFGYNILDPADIFKENVLYNSFDADSGRRRRSEWTLEGGYTRPKEINIFPFRTHAAYPDFGLTLKLYGSVNDSDSLCKLGTHEIKLIVFPPGELPQATRRYITLPINSEVLISLKPDRIETQDSVRSFSPDKRHCYYDSERYLRYFKTYTKSNCELECLANYTINTCGCAPIHMPRHQGIPICHLSSTPCYMRAKYNLIKSFFNKLTNETDPDTIEDVDCSCKHTCATLRYDVNVAHSPLHDAEEDPTLNYSQIKFFYVSNRIWAAQRTRLFDTLASISYAGGLLGVFVGFSIVSCIEIIYYCGNLILHILCLKNNSKKSSKE